MYRSLFPFGIGRKLGEVVAASRADAERLAKATYGSRAVVDPAPCKAKTGAGDGTR